MKPGSELRRHLNVLRQRDKHLARAVRTAGVPGTRLMKPGFATLIRIIVDQQVSVAAGAAIWAKLKRAAGGAVTAPHLLSLGEAGLRAAGMSGQKARYSLGLAEATTSRQLNLSALARANDDEVRETLISFKGIGMWTADVYLMFGMGRPDIWPIGDLGLQNAVQILHGLQNRPAPKELKLVAEPWRPYRSSAAFLLWHYYESGRVKR